MVNLYCENCKRMVGTKKPVVGFLVCLVLAILSLIVIPFFGIIVAAGMFVLGGLIYLLSARRCAICGGTRFGKNPEPSGAQTENG